MAIAPACLPERQRNGRAAGSMAARRAHGGLVHWEPAGAPSGWEAVWRVVDRSGSRRRLVGRRGAHNRAHRAPGLGRGAA
eukprot:3954011-Prymnesium_polylepis.1